MTTHSQHSSHATTLRGSLLALGLGLSLGACSPVGPDYEHPEVPLAEEWTQLDEGATRTPEELARWWEQLGDDALTDLVGRALDGNLQLRAAAARILEARAGFDVATGNLYPQEQTLNASAVRVGSSRDLSAGTFAPRITEQFAIGPSISWEIDLWGRLRRAIESSEATLEAAVANFDDVVVLLIAEVASSYVDVRTFEERLRLARENAELQTETLDLAEIRFEEGAVSILDVHQAQSIVGQTQALIPQFEAGRRRATHALSVLLGETPRDIAREIAGSDIPEVSPQVATGLPADLLRQRPDVRRSERELAAQSAMIGIAEAEFYPRLTLQGSIGYAADDPSDLFSTSSLDGSIGAGLDWKLFNYGRLGAGVRAEEARYDALLETYRNTILNAQREVEDALVDLARADERVDALRKSVVSSAAAAATVTEQYREGSVDYTAVFLAQTTLVEQQDAFAVSRGDRALALIDVYRALGGGWQIVQDADETEGPETGAVSSAN